MSENCVGFQPWVEQPQAIGRVLLNPNVDELGAPPSTADERAISFTIGVRIPPPVDTVDEPA